MKLVLKGIKVTALLNYFLEDRGGAAIPNSPFR